MDFVLLGLMFHIKKNRVPLAANLRGSFSRRPLQYLLLLLAGEACHMTTSFVVVIVVSNRIDTVLTKKTGISEEHALCQDTCDLPWHSLCLVGTTLGASYSDLRQ